MNANSIILGTYGAAHLGDAICSTPLVRQLHEERSLQVWMTCHSSTLPVYLNNPFLAGFSESPGVPLREFLSGNGHLIQRLQRGLGLKVSSIPKPEIFLTAEEREWAVMQKQSWPLNKPICIMSCRVITDGAHYEKVDWEALGAILSSRFTIIQAVITRPPGYLKRDLNPAISTKWINEPLAQEAIVYENLSIRQYLSLFSVVDAYCGGPSGGSHVAASFNLPSLIVIWRWLKNRLRFPAQGKEKSTGPEHFLYPHHNFIAAEDISSTRFRTSQVDGFIQKLARECCDVTYRTRRLESIALIKEPEYRPRRVQHNLERRIVFTVP